MGDYQNKYSTSKFDEYELTGAWAAIRMKSIVQIIKPSYNI